MIHDCQQNETQCSSMLRLRQVFGRRVYNASKFRFNRKSLIFYPAIFRSSRRRQRQRRYDGDDDDHVATTTTKTTSRRRRRRRRKNPKCENNEKRFENAPKRSENDPKTNRKRSENDLKTNRKRSENALASLDLKLPENKSKINDTGLHFSKG